MNLPIEFIKNTQKILDKEWEPFAKALTQEAPVSIRVNLSKIGVGSLPYPTVPWSETGYYLPSRPAFTFDPLFHAGAYYVQEASSMFIEQVFKQYAREYKNLKILDLCAAPGGKSTHIASLISEDSLLVSNEVIRSRASILSENIIKAGHPNNIVISNDPSEIGLLKDFFDIILIDAPCSGEGMFRKDPDSVNEWSAANVALCAERQQRIVADVWPALKPGGLLIYSTCTYNRAENEDNTRWICNALGGETLPIDHSKEWGIHKSYDEDLNAYHFFPHLTRGEGFFMSLLKKTGNPESISIEDNKTSKKYKKQGKKEILPLQYQQYFTNYTEFTFFDKNEKWYAMPTLHYEAFCAIASQLRLVSAGIAIGQFKGKDFIPSHSLAMSVNFDREAFARLNVDWKTAIAFLKKEPLCIPQAPKGYVLILYKNHPLGFVKNIGNRANNLYPNEWRIRSTRSPESEVSILNIK